MNKHKNNEDYFIKAHVLNTELNRRESRLKSLKSSLMSLVQDIEEKGGITYTDWYVLLKFNKDKNEWESACYCPYNDDDGESMPMEDFEVILPIPNPETLKEFEGF